MKTLRASEAPQVLACPGSMKHPQDTGSGPEAAMGRLEHGLVAYHLENGEYPPSIGGYADDAEERMMWNMWLQMHRELVEPLLTSAREMGAQIEIETPYECVIDGAGAIGGLSGHPDLLIPFNENWTVVDMGNPTRAIIFDWKFGRVESHLVFDQLLAYATLAVANYGAFEHIDVYACYLRSGNYDHRRLTMADIAEFGERVKYAGNNPDRLCSGEQCNYCLGATDCHEMDKTISVFARVADPDAYIRDMSPAQAIDAWGKMKAVKSLIAKMEKGFKSLVAGYNGRVEGPDGKALVSSVIRTNRTLDVTTSYGVLRQHGLHADEIDSCTTISLSKCEDVVSSKAERGQKGKAAKALVEDLDAIGAIKRKEIKSLKIEAMSKQIEKAKGE